MIIKRVNTKNIVGVICVVLTACCYYSLAAAMGKKPDSSKAVTPVQVSKIYNDQQCGLQQAQLVWIPSQQEYQTLFSNLRRSYIENQAKPPPLVEWQDYSAILVAMGQKNTGGYGLDVGNTDATVDDGVLSITLQWHEPKSGMIVTQVLTSPCLLLKVPKGDYHRIEIKDQAGETRLKVSVK